MGAKRGIRWGLRGEHDPLAVPVVNSQEEVSTLCDVTDHLQNCALRQSGKWCRKKRALPSDKAVTDEINEINVINLGTELSLLGFTYTANKICFITNCKGGFSCAGSFLSQ